MESQQSPTNFNQRVGATLQRIRTSAGWSQADLADQLAARGLPFQQPTVQKVERGSRPLRLEEAAAIADLLGVDLAMLTQYVDDHAAAEAIAQIQRSNATEDNWLKGLERQRQDREESDKQSADFLKRVRKVKQEAEEQLREAGGRQDDEGRWWWNGVPLALEVKGTDAGAPPRKPLVQSSTSALTAAYQRIRQERDGQR